MQTLEAVYVWLPPISCLTLDHEGSPKRGIKELKEEVMKTQRKIAFRTIGMVVAAFLTVAVTSGPADAAARHANGGGIVKLAKDTNWG